MAEQCVQESGYYIRSFLFLPVLGGHSGCGLSTKEGWGEEIEREDLETRPS